MVICDIYGGLGNQMFQYAAGRALSLCHGTELFLDLSSFEGDALHQGYELSKIFHCQSPVAKQSQIEGLLGFRRSNFAKKVLRQTFAAWLRGRSFVVEPHFHFWDNFLSLPNDVYLVGYWQSEKYFSSIFDVIRADFEFSSPFSSKNVEISTEMSNLNSVSIHVRRGDYVTNSKTHAIHGTCSQEYYLRAINYIVNNTKNAIFYFFSDDMSWVKKYLKTSYPCKYIEHNTNGQSFNDMRLMSFCKNHIIANSSFSWWGAWLGKNRKKIVVAPERWFHLPSINTQDVCPASWVRL